jgi:hypothetical protein
MNETAQVSANYTVLSERINYNNLVINEIDGNGKFVEIYNKGQVAIPLEKVSLIKNDKDIWWTGLKGVISAGGYYAIVQSGQTTAGAGEYTGVNGISAKQNVKFELRGPDKTVLDAFIRLKEGGAWSDVISPDYGSGTKYSFSRCPNGTGAFELAVPSCNAPNPAVSAGQILAN